MNIHFCSLIRILCCKPSTILDPAGPMLICLLTDTSKSWRKNKLKSSSILSVASHYWCCSPNQLGGRSAIEREESTAKSTAIKPFTCICPPPNNTHNVHLFMIFCCNLFAHANHGHNISQSSLNYTRKNCNFNFVFITFDRFTIWYDLIWFIIRRTTLISQSICEMRFSTKHFVGVKYNAR